jgi:energy-coupling factor transporter ATP-binding protein EcfA2
MNNLARDVVEYTWSAARERHKKERTVMTDEVYTAKRREIKQIVVKKLFGTLDHTIPLYEDGTTILVGPSGIGKTVILKLLNELFSKSNKILQTIPFGEFRVDFEDNTSFWVTKDCERPREQSQLTFHFRDESEQERIYTLDLPLPHKVAAEQSFLVSMGYDVIFEHTYADQGMERVLPTGEILSSADILQGSQEQPSTTEDQIPQWLAEVRQCVPIHFIDTQRLSHVLRTVKPNGAGMQIRVIPTVDVYAQELAELLRTDQAASPELSYKIEKLQKEINKLFVYKEMSVNPEQGFVFTDASGASLAPHELSLGEQNTLALFYELLFKLAPGAFVLIDEPDVSLHVVWQREFLGTLWGAASSRSGLLIVTHSPVLLEDHWDTVVPLKKVA